MRNWRHVVLAILAIAAGAGIARAAIDKQDFGLVERGRYLTIAADCNGCHTDPKDGRAFAGGRPIETPFGNVIASNITPDRETGIGAWTDDEFIRAVTRGISRNGTHLYPAMPYPYYARVSRDDLIAIRAYLATAQPVKNRVGGNSLPFPLDIRYGMVAWNKLFYRPGAFHAVPQKSAEWNRGAYLVEGLMHCGACHTPKNVAGGDKTSEFLQGSPVQGWFAPDITNAGGHGLKDWSTDDVVAYLRTGHNRFSAATGPMGEQVERSSSRLTSADLHAVAVYLKDQPGNDQKPPAPVAESDSAMKLGSQIYADECSACHAPDGKGQPGLFPSLAGSPAVQSTDPSSLLRVVLYGTRSVATDDAPTAPAMPAFGWLLNDRQAAAVVTYVRNSWGNAAAAVSDGQARNVRSMLAHRNE